MKQKQGVDVVTAALTSVCNALQKPETVYDLMSLLLTSRPRFEQADYYAAILDELKGGSNALFPSAHKRPLMGLLGHSVLAKLQRSPLRFSRLSNVKEPGL